MSLQVSTESDARLIMKTKTVEATVRRERHGAHAFLVHSSLLCSIYRPRPPHLKTYLLCASEFQGTEVQ